MTRILIETPYFGDRPYTKEWLQSKVPFTVLNVIQGSFEFTVEIEEDITQEQVDSVISLMKLYVLENLITGKIIE